MSADRDVVVEFVGEGKTDLGKQGASPVARDGLLPILTNTLCGRPPRMIVKRRRYDHLERKTLWQKAFFAKLQARQNRSSAVVFVIDSEGDQTQYRKKLDDLQKGRDYGLPDFPMAIGVAQPCIESWLLADEAAIRRGLKLPRKPAVPAEPEGLSAPCQDPRHNPKTVLAQAAGAARRDLAADQKWKIAAAMRDMDLARRRCPLSFAPFADEVEQRIRPLFGTTA